MISIMPKVKVQQKTLCPFGAKRIVTKLDRAAAKLNFHLAYVDRVPAKTSPLS